MKCELGTFKQQQQKHLWVWRSIGQFNLFVCHWNKNTQKWIKQKIWEKEKPIILLSTKCHWFWMLMKCFKGQEELFFFIYRTLLVAKFNISIPSVGHRILYWTKPDALCLCKSVKLCFPGWPVGSPSTDNQFRSSQHRRSAFARLILLQPESKTKQQQQLSLGYLWCICPALPPRRLRA